jgi:excisionase family DNA binding protein
MAARVVPHPRLVPAKQAAAELGIPYTTLRDLHFAGEIAVVKFGRAWYFDREALEALIARHTERQARG